jgi:adenylylsulfate kinase-like enzyme
MRRCEDGIVALMAVIAPNRTVRDEIRALHEASGLSFAEVHVATPVAVCARRDVKGLYARQRRGEIRELTGIDAPYEPPSHPELVILAHEISLRDCVARVCALVLSPTGARTYSRHDSAR